MWPHYLVLLVLSFCGNYHTPPPNPSSIPPHNTPAHTHGTCLEIIGTNLSVYHHETPTNTSICILHNQKPLDLFSLHTPHSKKQFTLVPNFLHNFMYIGPYPQESHTNQIQTHKSQTYLYLYLYVERRGELLKTPIQSRETMQII